MQRHFAIAALAAIAIPIGSARLRADEPFGKAADNRVYAQALVNEVVKSNPDLVIVGFHAVVPGAKDETMIASTLDRIGEKDDEEDLVVVAEQETILAVSLKEPVKFKVHIPMKDASGKVIGLMALIFRNDAGKDEAYYCARALAIRDGVARRIPDLQALFKPSP
jgi:hypothetical protein